MRNPFTIHDMAVITRRYFGERPLPGEDGLPVNVPEWRLSSRGEVITALDRAANVLEKGRNLVDRFPIPRSDKLELRMHKDQRKVDRLRRLNEIYWPYGELDCVFDDRNTRELLHQLHPDDRARFSFDVDEIDWDHYLGEVHLPALRAIAVPPASRPEEDASRPAGVPLPKARPRWRSSTSRASCSTPPSRTSTPGCARATCPSWTSSCGRPASPPACPAGSWRTAARRTAFNRNFYRLYKDLPARELRAQAKEALPDFIQPRIQNEAVRRIREHKRRGDKVILVTGALDFLVESLAHLGDELIAARLVERVGRFTGELAEPPLTADGRASLDRAPRRRPPRRPRRLPRLRRQPRRPADARARRPPARDQPGLPPLPRGAQAPLADRDVDDRARRG